jgi:hypothetical protein
VVSKPPAQPDDSEWQKWKQTIRLIILAVALLTAVAFVTQNFLLVEVRIALLSINVRLGWALLVAVALGFAAGYLWARTRR